MSGQGDDGKWGGGLWEAANLVTPIAIRVAATLRLADHVAAGCRTVDTLARAAGAHSDALRRLLRHLVSIGLLTSTRDGVYALTPTGEHLREGHPDGVRAWFDMEGPGRAQLSLLQLLHTIRTGKAAYPVQFGRSFYDDIRDSRDRADRFNQMMGTQVATEAPAIAAAYDWASCGHVMDLGGGNGSLLIALLRTHPTLRGTVLDMSAAIEAADKAIQEAGLADRADTLAGSFFDPLPTDAGAYVLSAVLLDWDDDDARAILRRSAEAAAPAGKVIVIDVLDEDGAELANTEHALRMLAYTGGRERTLNELTQLAAEAGLKVTSVVPAQHRSIVEMTVTGRSS